MKKLTTILSCVLLYTFTTTHSFSQSANGYIIGPMQVCLGTDAVFTLVPNSPAIPLYSIDGGATFQAGIPQIIYSNLSSGVYTLIAYDALLQPADSMVFAVTNHLTTPVRSTAIVTCPDYAAAGACEKVCAYSTVTYTVPEDDHITWDIVGAEKVDIDKNVATVQWGAAGSGQVNVDIGHDTANANQMILNCGHFSNFLDTSVAYVQISGCASPPFTYAWSTGDSTSVVYTNNILGFFSVTVTDAYGSGEICEVAYPTPVDYYLYPQIKEASDINTCDGAIDLNVAALSNFPFYNVNWTGPNGFSSNEEDISGLCCGGWYTVVVSWPGQKPETEAYYIDCGQTCCSSSNSICVDIIENPNSKFQTIPTAQNDSIAICKGQTVYFENMSSGADQFIWNFDDGTGSSNQHPEHTFQNPGVYQVQLIAKNACVCPDTSELTVVVSDLTIPDIECVGTVCVSDSATYYTPTYCDIYQWDISGDATIIDGGSNEDDFVTIIWNSGPQGAVSLTASNCVVPTCAETITKKINIINQAQIAGEDKVCYGDVEVYSIPEYNATHIQWFVSEHGTIIRGQKSASVTILWADAIPSAQDQWVAVVYDNCYLECNGQDTLPVFLRPKYYVEGEAEACENSNAILTARDVNDVQVFCNWEIIAPNGNTIAAFPNVPVISIDWNAGPGRYTVKTTTVNQNDYCNEEHTFYVYVRQLPIPPLGVNGPTQHCPGKYYTFLAQSTSSSHHYKWTVKKGNEPLVEIAAGQGLAMALLDDIYQISVAHVSDDGLQCESDFTTLTSMPLADIKINGADTLCQYDSETYTVPVYQDVSYSWSIIPNTAGTILNGNTTNEIDITWHKAGPAILRLNLCDLIVEYSIYVHVLPVPVVLHPAGLCPDDIANVGTTTPYASYVWEKAGSLISDSSKVILDSGYYHLHIIDSNSCAGDTTFFIDQYVSPIALIDVPLYLGLCPDGPPVTIAALNTVVGLHYQWYQDGIPVGTDAPTFATNVKAEYQVVVTNTDGCADTSNTLLLQDCEATGDTCINNICMGKMPDTPCTPDGIVSFQVMPTPDCNIVQFNNTSVNLIPGSQQWFFIRNNGGPSATSFELNPLYAFANSPGYYSIILTGEVPNIDGTENCLLSVVEQIVIPALADFAFEGHCQNMPVTFTDISAFMPMVNLTDWQWDFGDPTSGSTNISTDTNPQHIYQDTGFYTVTLTITTSAGCTTSVQKTIVIKPEPSISFEASESGCQNTAIAFDAITGTFADKVLWDFGDPDSGSSNTSKKVNTYHKYENPGVYLVTIVATDVIGCQSRFSDSVTIDINTLSGDITLIPQDEICEGDSAIIGITGNPAAWLWSTGDTTPTIVVSKAGLYDVTITDVEGCTYSPPTTRLRVLPELSAEISAIEFNDFGQPATIFYNSYSVCEGEDVYLQISGGTGYNYQWSSGHNTTSVIYSLERDSLLAVGAHEFTVTVTDANGCTSVEGPFIVFVDPNPPDPTVNVDPLPPLCEGVTTTISLDSPDTENIYIWNTGDFSTSITQSTAGAYFVRAINMYGCASQSDPVIIRKGPDIHKIPDGCHYRCNPDSLCLPPIPDIISWQWYFNGNPLAAPHGNIAEPPLEQSGEYYVVMTDTSGCSVTSKPFTVDLYEGYGDIVGNVYDDVNENGVIDAGDTLISGIVLIIYDGSMPLDTISNESDGSFGFYDIAAHSYTVKIDTASLPNKYVAILSSADIHLIGCDTEEQQDYLIQINCSAVFTTHDTVACAGTLYNYNGTLIPAGTSQNFTYTSVKGCDSIVTVVVEALSSSQSTLVLSACLGDSAEYHGFTIAAGEQMDVVLTNVDGCDSIVSVSVDVLQPTTATLILKACPAGSVVYQGQTLAVGSVTDFHYVNSAGCDSVLTVTVAERTLAFMPIVLDVCKGENTVYNGDVLSAGDIKQYVFTDIYNCDSIVEVTVNEFPEFDFTIEGDKTLCWNDSFAEIVIIPSSGGTQPVSFSLNNGTFQPENIFTQVQSGTHQVAAKDGNGCTVSKEINIPVIAPVELDTTSGIMPCNAVFIVLDPILQASGDFSVLWSDGSTLPQLEVTTLGEYTITVTNECESKAATIDVQFAGDSIRSILYIPNVFSPNQDGHNDLFRIEPHKDVQVLSFYIEIFDRWGNRHFTSDDISFSWDGSSTKILDPGVFVWYIRAKVVSCGRETDIFEKGDVTVVR